MVKPARSPRTALLLVALFLSAAFAGCTDKNDRSAGPDDPFVTVIGSEEPLATLDDYTRIYTEEAPRSCDGCIALDPEPTRQAQSGNQPVAIEEGVTVPWPKRGDQFILEGYRRSPTGPELGGFPFGLASDQSYHADVALDAVLPGPGGFAPVIDDVARFVFDYRGSGYPLDDDTFHPDSQEVYLDLDTRAASAVIGRGETESRPEATFGAYNTEQHIPAEHVLLPRYANMFWLGSHLWGDTLHKGDERHYAWTPPGFERPQIWFDYTVEEAARVVHEDGSTHGAGGEHVHWLDADSDAPELVVRLDVHDPFGKVRKWRLSFDDESPYPTLVRLIRDTHASVDRSLVPPEITWQRIFLGQRGSGTIDWSANLHQASTNVRSWDNEWFRLDGRYGAPALDRLPIYPIGEALTELSILEPTFNEWRQRFDDHVLIDARLDTRLVVQGTNHAKEHVWTLLFASGTGGARAWEIVRSEAGPGHQAPVAHDARPVDPPPASHLTRRLSVDAYPDLRLAAGTGLRPAWSMLATGGEIDQMHYQLVDTSAQGLTGTLRVGTMGIDVASGLERVDGGYVVQDLRTGAIIEAVTYDRS